MLKDLYPYEYMDSVFAIDYRKLYDKGFRGIIFDLDMTLVAHGDPSNPKVDRLFEHLHKLGFKTLILSDNDQERIESFLVSIRECPYIADANKPAPDNYLKAVEQMNLRTDQVIYIGDQLFLDIYGANRAGIPNILVRCILHPGETKIGKKRRIEYAFLKLYLKSKSYTHRLGDIQYAKYQKPEKKRKLFCDISPTTYKISMQKGIILRHLRNLKSKEKIARTHQDEILPNLLAEHSNVLIKTGKGIDPVLQENKAVNIDLACKKLNKLMIRPGETFSFWLTVGKPTKWKGYKDGRVIIANQLRPGLGGGLCNLGNTIHRMVLLTPLDVTEFHSHSDALAPDHGQRVPFSSGTSVSYNYIDYRFRNNTDQNFQLLLWCEDGYLRGELRSEKEFPWTFEVVEEDHHFHKEGRKYYRISKIYKQKRDRETGEILEKKLVLDNHSEVMFDYSQIPEDQIR